MKKILIINASARQALSKSRMLTNAFVEEWESHEGNAHITYRDLAANDIPFVDENWVAAAAKPKAYRTTEEAATLHLSDGLIAEIKANDMIVIGTPMYNWSIPGVLKGYIDQIVRVNETWRINREDPSNPYLGLLENKTLILLLSRGGSGYEPGEANAHMNFQSTYLKTVFNIMGINDVQTIAINGESQDPERLKISIADAVRDVKSLVSSYLVDSSPLIEAQ
ncbi:FMN-dependent NADH-azoreductase [Mucilaginibacter lappiensis]|uniref:FMN dependent NADH:quinone oxidoreductase n=1 Tax=Mucilaginibacter lappiensis TaxID=354630 RepID=A0ABR6PDE0_9SPHI|nr:NAD(P)H-dependent oxidoreductase [Mucilaginibacter lappiensis]MBB6107780.1 FMN-dependent NADH-azoreductase [Mucilaginibacter lappiensis]SIP97406.1 FMN-dependent NADH-azoreductase [Mucilaginibacter lappiensis]